ncbi:diadenylate cyclase CdaA [Streptococcus sp. CSL10205-OR2]|uniref:diadenylate cyclase CdaA n=1 Tax=Streptococcus sp. CSL10205-OR2 TaxID=2980558 RepID=UPI0021D90134|nr:diadenylate cyclase CdaA [Streptococcus sp. CSL10205-OR2]MCU9533625.1 diadenylate cyclase CdaA [Streptococcus sp. CSL10205-OR2]
MSNLFNIDANFWRSLFDNPITIIINLIDILIVSWLIYRFIKALAGTKVMSLVQGAVLFVVIRFISGLLGFSTLTYLMNQVITYGVIAGVIIFAPEIRSGLERFGRTPQSFIQTQTLTNEEKLITALVKAVKYMSPRKIGALIAIENTQGLREYISTGIPLDADVSSQLLINIFIPNTPLHDGAVIISGNKVAAASCYLPLTDSKDISKEFGTRHRAAIGLSERSDALTVIISEETGAISIAYKERLAHDLSLDEFDKELHSVFSPKDKKKRFGFNWKKLLGGKKS